MLWFKKLLGIVPHKEQASTKETKAKLAAMSPVEKLIMERSARKDIITSDVTGDP